MSIHPLEECRMTSKRLQRNGATKDKVHKPLDLLSHKKELSEEK